MLFFSFFPKKSLFLFSKLAFYILKIDSLAMPYPIISKKAGFYF